MPRSESDPLHCLICSVPIQQCHLGIDSCRACAVFYKRTVNNKRPLKCKGGEEDCLNEDPTSSCRKCRFARFSEVFDKACGGEKPEWLQKPDDEMTDSSPDTVTPEDPRQAFIDHTSYFTSEPSCSDTPIIERMKRAYSVMCLVRRTGELASNPFISLHRQLAQDEMKSHPATYATVVPSSMLFFTALIDFTRAAFDNYAALSAENRHLLIFRAFRFVYSLDGLYRAIRHFPDCDTLMPCYTMFANHDSMEHFFDDCPYKINKQEALAEVRKNMARNVGMSKAHFKQLNPAVEELMALIGLTIFGDDTERLSEEMITIVNENRAAIMSELHVFYARKSGTTDYAARLGELLCLLVNVEKSVDLTYQDVTVYRMMNLFNEVFEEFPYTECAKRTSS